MFVSQNLRKVKQILSKSPKISANRSALGFLDGEPDPKMGVEIKTPVTMLRAHFLVLTSSYHKTPQKSSKFSDKNGGIHERLPFK